MRRSAEARARRQLLEAVEDVLALTRQLGLPDPTIAYAPWRLRAEAWLWRASQLLKNTDR
jgi:hypothetical protein